jgi:hypothetical protein
MFSTLSSEIRLFLKDRFAMALISISFVLVLFSAGYVFWYIRPTDAQIFLHYSVLFGVDRVGKWWEVYRIPATGLGIFVTNTLLALAVYRQNNAMAYVLLLMSLLTQVFLVVAAILVVFLNI